MNMTRRNFLEGLGMLGASAAFTGCTCPCACFGPKGRIALQLYSLKDYIRAQGLAKTLADVAKIGYTGVEFYSGIRGFKAEEIRKMLDDNGLVSCGTHLPRTALAPENFRQTAEFELALGNTFICCPGGADQFPAKGENVADFMKKQVAFYNEAAQNFATFGCLVGLHNHTGEFDVKLADGTTYWDYFFAHTDKAVQMEQDVGWTTCAGYDPCEQYVKYPHRAVTLHAKENGMGKGVTTFDAILGQPGQPGAKGVDWNRLLPIAEADGVKWWVVECEKHFDDLTAVTPSYAFLKMKGLK